MELERADLRPSDGELVTRARAGSAEAFGTLVTRYQDSVYNLCHRLCHDEGEALDMAQAAFLNALQALPRFEERARFSTWLYRIAVNVVLSWRRRARRRPTVALDEPAQRLQESRWADAAMRPDEGLIRAELHARVGAALALVEPEFRVAVVLKDVEDLDYEAIAEILGVPVGTVKSRIYRGRMRLRELLAAERTEVASGKA